MKRLLALTNFLLAVIAVCLCLIVTKLYDFTIVAPAHAQEPVVTMRTPSEPLPVRIVNERVPCTVEGTVDARLHAYEFGWSPVNARSGAVTVRDHE